MARMPDPKHEQPSTYVIEDRSNRDELERLCLLDQLFTKAMGGVVPEQPDPTIFERVLDVGCGTGGWLIELAKATPSCKLLIGVDANRNFVEYARTQAEAAGVNDRVEFHVGDALRMLEFPDHFFDLVNHRSAVSWLRTWDWRKLLQEYQRVCRPGGIVRITEPDWPFAESSPSLQRLTELGAQALFHSGHCFTSARDDIISHLASILERHGLRDMQTRSSALLCPMGTPEWQSFFEHNRLGFRILVPFMRKWMHLPEDYEETYQQMLGEMQQQDFVGIWKLLTIWGHPSAGGDRSDYFAR